MQLFGLSFILFLFELLYCLRFSYQNPWQPKTVFLFQSCVCFFPVDYTILIYMVNTIHSCTLRDLFT